jgi:hypothetical protein
MSCDDWLTENENVVYTSAGPGHKIEGNQEQKQDKDEETSI